MIVVEIPAALAADPQVVPVDASWLEGQPFRTRRITFPVESLVGERVAFAWRETCPTSCDEGGRDWSRMWDGVPFRCVNDCTNGERMVVGWTAEVEAAVPIVRDPEQMYGDLAIVNHLNELHAIVHDRQIVRPAPPTADWSPGRYALVLRDVRGDTFFGDHDQPAPCRTFSGFAELDEVL